MSKTPKKTIESEIVEIRRKGIFCRAKSWSGPGGDRKANARNDRRKTKNELRKDKDHE